jgi:hypothetical protein
MCKAVGRKNLEKRGLEYENKEPIRIGKLQEENFV